VLVLVSLSWLPGASAEPVRFTAGLTRSSLFEATGWSAGLGARVGASVALPLAAGVWFEPELAWTLRTTSASSDTDGATLTSRMTLQYLEVPMLLKRRLFRQPRFAPIVLGGVYYAVNIAARVHTGLAGQSFDENARSEVARHDAGWVAGGGLEVQAGRRTWTVEVRYVGGLRSVNVIAGSTNWRTRSVTTAVGVKW